MLGGGLEVRLAPTARAPWEARGAVERLARDLRPEELDALRLLVSELVTNSVRHAGMGRDGWIDLDVSVVPDAVRVTVTDPGGSLVSPGQPADPAGPSGWGLFLVQRMADRWGIASDGHTRVWFELHRSR